MSGENRAYFGLYHHSKEEIAMVNQKLFTMKQPELGKRISETRKAKGLTQEELVEKCNLNVRTIQRIEAGEVTPRSYTIKAILEALEINLEKSPISLDLEEEKEFPDSLRKFLQIGFVFGILYFIAAFIEFPMDMEAMEHSEMVDLDYYLTIKLVTLIFFSVFIFSFSRIGAYSKNFPLKISSYLLILSNLFGVGSMIYLVVNGQPVSWAILIPEVVVAGGAFLFFGFSFTQFKSPWKSIVGPLGVVGMITGLFYITLIGAVAGLVIQVVFEIGLLYFILWYTKKSGRISSPDSLFSKEVQA